MASNGNTHLLEYQEDDVLCQVLLHGEKTLCSESIHNGMPLLTFEKTPPLALQESGRAIDEDTWARFHAHVFAAHFRGISTPLQLAILVFWWIMLIAMFSTRGNFLLHNIIVILLLLSFILDHQHGRSFPHDLQCIVTKMQPTFAQKGLSIHLDSCWYWFSCQRYYFVRFVRLPLVEEGGLVSMNETQAAKQSETYQPQDWKFLEGTWVKIGEIHGNDADKTRFDFVFQEKSLVWAVTGTAAAETFDMKKEVRYTLFHLFPKHVVTHAKPDGNAIQSVPLQANDKYARLHKMMRIEPLLVVDGEKDIYYKQGDYGIIHIESGNRMKNYSFEFAEDVPSKEAILLGELKESNLPERSGVSFFEKKRVNLLRRSFEFESNHRS